MKKHIVLAILLAVGMSVYPQSIKSEKGAENQKRNVKKEAVRQSTGKSEVKTGNERRTNTGETAVRQSTGKSEAKTSREVRTTSGQQEQNIRNQKVDATSRSGNNAVRKTGQSAATKPDAKTRTMTGNTGRTRIERSADPPAVKISSSSANRIYREDKVSLSRDDGTVIRHQNNEIFTKSAYKVDYDNYDMLRRSDDFRSVYNDYNFWYDSRTVRYISRSPRYRPMPVDYRREHFVYRQPMHYDLIWTPFLFNRFMYYYPSYTSWDIEYGREIETIPAYDVMDYVGTVRRIYGKVDEVYYSREDYNYILYIGAPFPYQDMSIIIPRDVARRITRNPEWYFENQHIWVIGLIDMWEDKPEVVIRDEEQIRRY